MPGRLFLRQRFKHHGHRVGAGVHIAAQAIAVQVRCAPGARFAGVKRTIRARLRRGDTLADAAEYFCVTEDFLRKAYALYRDMGYSFGAEEKA